MKNFPTFVRITAESLIQQISIPVLNIGVGTLVDIHKQYQEGKFNIFLEEVKRGTADISIQNLNDYDILHTAYLTQQALLKIHQQEKIKLLADLFISYCHKLQPEHNDPLNDKYELILHLLENISFIEFQILSILHNYEISLNIDCGRTFESEHSFYSNQCEIWAQFIDEVKSNLDLSDNEIEAYLQRLTTTGLFVKFRQYIVDKGYLTQLFYELVNFLQKAPYHPD